MSTRDDSKTRAIFEIVRANPGIGRDEIVAQLPFDIKLSTVNNLLGRLARQKAIENRGGINRFQPAQWYPTESASEPYLQIAQDLLEELRDVHNSHRVSYLAKRLADIFPQPEGA